MINNLEIDTGGKRRIIAPNPTPSFYGNRDTTTGGDIISVWVHPDELVEWIWTSYPDGSRKVTEYKITKVTMNHAEEATRAYKAIEYRCVELEVKEK